MNKEIEETTDVIFRKIQEIDRDVSNGLEPSIARDSVRNFIRTTLTSLLEKEAIRVREEECNHYNDVIIPDLLEKQQERIAGEVEKDKERLDFLDECNHRLNEYHGTNYGWELILNHNVTRLLSGNLNRIDLNDANGSKDKSKSCREAIDKALSIVRNNP